MLLETFRGRDLSRVLARVRAAYGDDAILVRNRRVRKGDGWIVEVVATSGEELEAFRRRIEREPLRVAGTARARRGPHVVALVGSPGAGKTTTIAKLALHPAAFGGRRVGLITLDTYRVAALEQLAVYAEIMDVPLEVVYGAAEVGPALERLRDCDVILVDTPGRSPNAPAGDQSWRTLLERIGPDEVHVVIPASTRVDVALAVRDAFAPCGITHALLTKVDEVPGEEGVIGLAEVLNLPARWVSTGQDVPTDLHPAAQRLLSSLCGGADRVGAAGIAG